MAKDEYVSGSVERRRRTRRTTRRRRSKSRVR